VEAQYNFNFSFADIITGASLRRYDPNSFGTIFEDTLINAGDTLMDGKADPTASYIDISSFEYGGYLQASKRIWNDKLKLSGSIRIDKSQNYSQQLSPRLSAVFSYKDHNFRVAAQSAFRSPTLQNQFLLIDLGPIMLTGNLNGSGNLSKDGFSIPFYTLESVGDFMAMYDSVDANNNYVGEVKPELLKSMTISPLVPEQVKTIEFGYRGILGRGLYVDLNAYYGVYTNFIGNIRLALPHGEAVAGEETGMDAVLTDDFQPYQVPVNAQEQVSTYGASMGLAYYFGKGMMAKVNYTYAELDTSGLEDPIIPGFNTPRNKFNIGLTGRRIWREMGFSINYKWIEKFYWESSFGDGDVPGYNLLDMQMNYEFKDMNSKFAIGASNLLGNRHIEAYGAPTIGRLFYASWSFQFDEL
jgi:outer membrane receptor protein involved in Fe transport